MSKKKENKKEVFYFIQAIEVETNQNEAQKLGNLWSEDDLLRLLSKQYPHHNMPAGVFSDGVIVAKFGNADICKSIDEYNKDA